MLIIRSAINGFGRGVGTPGVTFLKTPSCALSKRPPEGVGDATPNQGVNSDAEDLQKTPNVVCDFHTEICDKKTRFLEYSNSLALQKSWKMFRFLFIAGADASPLFDRSQSPEEQMHLVNVRDRHNVLFDITGCRRKP